MFGRSLPITVEYTSLKMCAWNGSGCSFTSNNYLKNKL